MLARRLNRTEYNNSVRDLLGVHSQPADDFPPDDSAFGFDNIAQALSISPSLMEKYLATADRVAREAVFGPPVKKNQIAILYASRATPDGVHQSAEGRATRLLFDVRLRPDGAVTARLFPLDVSVPCRRRVP